MPLTANHSKVTKEVLNTGLNKGKEMKGHVKQIFTVNILTLLCKWFVIGGFLNLNCSMLHFHIY